MGREKLCLQASSQLVFLVALRRRLGCFLLLLLAQFSWLVPPAYALSPSCTTLSALSTTNYVNSFPAATFASGESVSVSYNDDGGDTSGLAFLATDHVLFQNTAMTNAYGQVYYSSSMASGLHSFTLTSAQLTSTGLSINIKTGTHIGPVTISCAGAVSAPTVANISAGVAANSSNNALPLAITGTATSVAVASAPSHGTVSISGTSILYTPAAGYSGTDSLTYTATNAGGTSTAATASITVTAPLPAPPTVTNISASVAANSSNNALPLAITGTATSVAVASAPSHGTVSISGTSILYTPAAGYSGNDSLTYTATNAGGTSTAATASITVTAPLPALPTVANISASVAANSSNNALPLAITGTATSVAVASAPSHGTVSISGTSILYTPTAGYSGTDSLTYTATNAGGTSTAATASITVTAPLPAPPTVTNISASVAANSSNNALPLAITGTATSVAVASAPSHGTVSISGTSILYTPAAGYSGTDSLTYTATNAGGTSTAATASITVTAPLPAPPTVANISASVAANSSNNALPLAITGTATSVAVASAPSHGTVSISGTSILYTPAAGYSGTDSLTYTATNAGGTSTAATASITVTVPLPAPPTVANISASVAANSSNNALPLAITGTATSVAVASAPSHGTVSISGTSILYTPAAGYSGTDSLTYTATNAGGTSTAATASITVTAPLPAPPTVANISASVAANSSNNALPLAITGTATSVAVASAPSHGTVSISGTSILYTPAAGYSGTDSLTYTATNAGGTSTAATASITVTAPLPAPPTVANISASVAANSSNNALPLAITGTATSVAVASAPSHGTVSISGTSILYTPAAGFFGTDSFTYTATNRGGTAAAATASITVSAPPLSMSPAAGALPSATASKSYQQTFAAAGGTGTYTYAASTMLPPGVTLSSQGLLSGTPSTAGTYSFTVTATDSASSSFALAYTLTVAPAPGNPPTAIDRSVSVKAGQAIVVNLAEGSAGAPYTGASLLSTPSEAEGKASVSNGVYLGFTAAAQAAGDVALRYTLSNAFGTSNEATLTIHVVGRPDPSKDQQVIGLVNAQGQSAVQFASAQIGNFNNRLEHLHRDEDRRAKSFDLNISLPRNTRNQEIQDAVSPPVNAGVLAKGAAKDAGQGENPAAPDHGQDARDSAALAIWAGGYVNFIKSDRDSLRLDRTTAGISAGADYRFSRSFVAGLGAGFGRDASDVATSGTENKGSAASAVLYASYHPGPLFVDGLLGYGGLEFDSHRYVTETGGYADGSRHGRQLFGAISNGYEFKLQNLMLAPYARIQFSSSLLRHYSESGAGIDNLAYASQRIKTMAAVAGLRSQYGLPVSWGTLRLTGRVEYSDAIRRNNLAKLGYADVGDDTYTVGVLGLDQKKWSVSAGVDFLLNGGLAIGLDYQGMRSLDGSSRENGVLVRAEWNY